MTEDRGKSHQIPRKRRMARLKKGDLIILGLIAAAVLVVNFIDAKQVSLPNAEVYAKVVKLEDETTTFHPLFAEQNENLTFQGPEGITTVHLQDGAAAVTFSDCPDQLCVDAFGWIQQPGQVSLCLPNRIMVQIVDAEEVNTP